MIEKEKIQAVKQGIDLVALIQSRGITLKKNGKGYVGACPFHEDKNPSLSVNPETNLWQCFGCGQGGDAIRFIELHDKVSFSEAVKRLSKSCRNDRSDRNDHDDCKDHKKTARPPAPAAIKAIRQPHDLKVLTRVIEFYHTAFCEDIRARDYLAGRGLTDNTLFADYKLGFANGTLLNVLPQEGDILDQLKNLGILNDKGNEHFYGCVTFPLFDASGSVPIGIYGRRITGMGGGPDHLYLPGPRQGLFNSQVAKANTDIILAESIIDAMSLVHAGIRNVIPCYGVNGLTEELMEHLKHCGVKEVYICFDSDEAGRTGTEAAAARLEASNMRTFTLTLPEGEDLNSFFSLTADAKARFIELLAEANPERRKAVKGKNPQEGNEGNENNEGNEGKAGKEAAAGKERYTLTDYGFTVTISERCYELRGISKAEGRLKATVKGIRQDKRFHIDTLDLYSARSRMTLSKGLAVLFGADEQVITSEVERLLDLTEAYRKPDELPEKLPSMTEADREEALVFLKNSRLLEEILEDFETIGSTGEEMNKLLCYIAAVSRKMEEPLSVMIQSRSAAGKSFLQDAVLSLIPESDYVKYTRLTDQALFYKDSKSLSHKILAIEELDGMNGAVYSIRSIQTSKKITIAYTGKDPLTGRMQTEENTVEGPLMVFITTTAIDIDGETASRFVFVSIDESREMTEKIFAKQRERHTLEGLRNKLKAEGVIRKHKAAQELLKPLAVLNPYARLLTFTSKSLRARRDHTKYLNLIAAIAYLFQYQRKVRIMEEGGKATPYINVTLSDIEKANLIADEVLGRSLDELTPPSRELLKLIRDMVLERCKEMSIPPHEYRFSRKDIRDFSSWSDFQVKTHITQLEELEYIYSLAGRKGKEYVYELLVTDELKEDRPFLPGLIEIGQLKKKAHEMGIIDED